MAPAALVKKAVRFMGRQVREVREGGLRVFFRKSWASAMIVLMTPVILVVRALRPIALIRFGLLPSPRMGHFAGNTELYLCERDLGLQNNRAIDIFYLDPTFVCNTQLKKMWCRILYVSWFARWLDKTNRLLPGCEKHVIPMRDEDYDFRGVLSQTRVHLCFTPEEERFGRAAVRSIGIPEGSPYVCLFARDSAYLDRLHTYYSREHWRYHDYRDSDILNCIAAAEELARRGYYVVRMGALVQKPLPSTLPQVIDYALNGRTDFLDIFLSAKCSFFLGSTAGLSAIPRAFRRAIAYINFVPLNADHLLLGSPGSLFIPKKLWLREERRFMTFREIRDSGVGSILRGDQYESCGIELIENTSEEITSVGVEMDERLKGAWKTTEEDEELQQQFRSLFKPGVDRPDPVMRIGAEFLRQHRALLN